MADTNNLGELFEVHIIGNETGDLFPGTFRAKQKLSWNDYIQIDKYRRELIGPNAAEADISVQNRCMYVAELSVRLTESPDWWKQKRGGLDIVDDNVVIEVYEKALQIRKKWLDSVQVKADETKKIEAQKK